MPAVFLELGADQDPVFTVADLSHMESLLRELQRLTVHEPVAYEVTSSGLLTLILGELFASRSARAGSLALGEESRSLSKPVRMALDYFGRHYDIPVSLKHLAVDICKLSLSYFSRLFHREVGTSPIVYLNRYRVEQAKKFLADGNQSVAEIARSVGFRSLSYFTRTFVRIVGVSPLAYRKHPEKTPQAR
jgi:AraC-like DNA-binding protein